MPCLSPFCHHLAHPSLPLPLQAHALGLGVAVASSGSPEKIARNLSSSGLAPLFPDLHLVRPSCYRACPAFWLLAMPLSALQHCDTRAPGAFSPRSCL
jgi:beta-phosphoglucomutase-like phosphatase (HAD superfamily)